MNWFLKKSHYQERDLPLFETSFYYDPLRDNQPVFIIDGYVLPRSAYFQDLKEYSQQELIKILFLKNGKEFIKFIKGVFVIVILFKDRFLIYTDRHSIKKYFVYFSEGNFIISNSLETISANRKLEVDRENAAEFTLLSHFISGDTLFKDVYSSKPAEYCEFINNELKFDYYWRPHEILKGRSINNGSLDYYSETWKKILDNYISFLKPGGISVTLTGGNDSRMVLAALLSLKTEFHSFTYGDPDSYDGSVSGKLSDTINGKHNNYFIEKPTSDWFEKHARDLVKSGDSLINIHRAHRYDAITLEHNLFPGNEMVFTGLVGGEYLKEPRYNDEVLPILFKQLQGAKDELESLNLINAALKKNGINLTKIKVPEVHEKLMHFIKNGEGLNNEERSFIYTYLFYGCSHHTQDSVILARNFKYVVNPFMDEDFLEMVAGYSNWYLNKKVDLSGRLFHSEFIVSITDRLAPELSKIPYAKRGKYNADDLVNNKIKYLAKRLSYLVIKDKEKYPPNFPIGNWMYEFCKNQVADLSGEIAELFDAAFLSRELEVIKNRTDERSWHIITNPINLQMIYEQYK